MPQDWQVALPPIRRRPVCRHRVGTVSARPLTPQA